MDGGTDVEWKTVETVDDRLGDAELEREEDLRPRVCRSLKVNRHTRHRRSPG